MKFWNIDLHCSVITDVTRQFRALGHSVESHNMSGHTRMLGIPRASKGTGEGPQGKVGYGGVNLNTWEGLFNDGPEVSSTTVERLLKPRLDDFDETTARNSGAFDPPDAYKQVRAWQGQHPELDKFDGFVVTYPPAFALLFERFKGKVVLDIPIRYDLHFTERPEAWRDFNARLASMWGDGRLVAVANSRYDANYFTYFTGLPCRYVSSTCDYIDHLAPKWAPRGSRLLAFGEHSGCREAAKQVSQVLFVRDVLPEYQHAEISMARGIVWIPYNCSIMSFFEHYWLGIPMFVPTKRFLVELWHAGLALSQLTWHRSLTGGSKLERAGTDLPDPHTEEGVRAWMGLYDFYNEAEFPYLTYFDSWDELKSQLASNDDAFGSVSTAMRAFNNMRRVQNLQRWREALGG